MVALEGVEDAPQEETPRLYADAQRAELAAELNHLVGRGVLTDQRPLVVQKLQQLLLLRLGRGRESASRFRSTITPRISCIEAQG